MIAFAVLRFIKNHFVLVGSVVAAVWMLYGAWHMVHLV